MGAFFSAQQDGFVAERREAPREVDDLDRRPPDIETRYHAQNADRMGRRRWHRGQRIAAHSGRMCSTTSVRALVTGCAGFIGSHLTESLLGDGHDVLGVDCFNDNYGRGQKLRNLERAYDWSGFEFVPVDLSRGDLDDLVEDVDLIYHLAAEPGVRPSWGGRFGQYLNNNVLATQHVLDAVQRRSDCRVVYASSSSVYGEAETLPTHEDLVPRPHSPYGVTKLSGEHLCRLYGANHGVDTLSLRYFSVYGPRQRPDMAFTSFCAAILAERPIEVFGDGSQTRDFTFVGDIVAATRAAGTCVEPTHRILNVGGGSRIALNEAIGVLEHLAGRPVEVRRGEGQKGDVRNTGADITAAATVLGYRPSVSIEAGLEAQWEWARAVFGRQVA